MSTLNYRHRLFLHHLMNDAKDDPVRAARMAGYPKPEDAANRLLANHQIAAYLEQKLEESGAMPVAEILARLSAVASIDPTEFLQFTEVVDKNGNVTERPSLDIKKLRKLGKGHLIKELKVLPSGHVEVKFQDSVDAMDKLAKYHGMFKERIEITHNHGDAGSDRILAILGGLSQLAGAIRSGETRGEPEPGSLCDRGEQWEVDSRPAPPPGQPTLALGGPEGD